MVDSCCYERNSKIGRKQAFGIFFDCRLFWGNYSGRVVEFRSNMQRAPVLHCRPLLSNISTLYAVIDIIIPSRAPADLFSQTVSQAETTELLGGFIELQLSKSAKSDDIESAVPSTTKTHIAASTSIQILYRHYV